MTRIAEQHNIYPATASTGSQSVSAFYTNTGFDAGDYVYYSSGSIGYNKSANVPVGYDYSVIFNSTYSDYIQTASYKSAAYGPENNKAIYSGTTRTVAANFSTPIVWSTYVGSTNYGCSSALLTSGKIVSVSLYNNVGAGIATPYAIICNKSGVYERNFFVTNSTSNVNVNTAGRKPVAVCALPNDTFLTCMIAGTNITYSVYNSAGTAIVSSTNVAMGVTVTGVSVTGFSNGGALVVCTGTTNPAVVAYYFYIAPNGVAGTVSNSVILAGTAGTQGTIAWQVQSVVPTNGVSSSLYALIVGCDNATAPSNCGVSLISISQSNAISVAFNTQSLFSSATSTLNNMTGLSVGTDGIVAIATNQPSLATGFTVKRYSCSTSGLTLVSTADDYTNSRANGNNCVLNASDNGSFILSIWGGASAGSVYLYKISGATITSLGTVSVTGYNSSTTIYGQFSACSNLNFGTCIVLNNANGETRFVIVNNQTLTNSVTELFGNSPYSYANGYNLIGIALTTAAAGSVGLVVTKGIAQLSSSYTSLTNAVPFVYPATTTVGAMSGSASGRNVTLIND